MHTLEHMLFMLSERIRRELGNSELSDAAKRLASESHNYERTSDGPDPLRPMHEDWSRRFTAPVPATEPDDT